LAKPTGDYHAHGGFSQTMCKTARHPQLEPILPVQIDSDMVPESWTATSDVNNYIEYPATLNANKMLKAKTSKHTARGT
jgi:hypothetical protein